MNIRKLETNKRQYLTLLLLADEQESMVDRYLERGTMYVLEDNGVKAECVVTDEGDGVLELKTLPWSRSFRAGDTEKPLWTFSFKPTEGSIMCYKWALGTAL